MFLLAVAYVPALAKLPQFELVTRDSLCILVRLRWFDAIYVQAFAIHPAANSSHCAHFTAVPQAGIMCRNCRTLHRISQF